MEDKMKKSLVAIASACGLALVCSAVLLKPGPASAQRGTVNLHVRTSVADDSFEALKQHPVMISVVKDGQVVKQSEAAFNSSTGFSLPAGLYDVRLEGDGMQTLVKRGVHVNEGEATDLIGGPMHAGAGGEVGGYPARGVSRAEGAARLAQLEAEGAEFQNA